jgi:hypothetical protein
LYQSPSVPDGSVIYGRDQRFTMVRAGVGMCRSSSARSHARNKAARHRHGARLPTRPLALTQEIRTQLQQAQQRYAAQLARVEAFEQGALRRKPNSCAGRRRRPTSPARSTGSNGACSPASPSPFPWNTSKRSAPSAAPAFELNAFNEQ